jgi:putative membrane protein
MRNVWKLLCYDAKHLFGNVITVVIVLGLVFLPSIFTWYNVVACWNVFDNTGQLKVAVANSDSGYESDLLPTKINVGDSVESALRQNDQLDWVFTTEEDAIDGAASGKYYAAVVIPENFSQNMMSFYTSDAESAQIIYYENEKKNAVAPRVTDQASTKVSTQVNETFAETIADVALSVVDTLNNLADDSDAQGAIAKVSNTISSSASQLDTAANVLDSYAALTGTARKLVSGSNQLLSDAKSAVNSAESDADEAKSGASDIADALKSSVSSLSGALEQSSASFDGIPQAIDDMYSQVGQSSDTASQSIRDSAVSVNDQIERFQDLKTQLEGLKPIVDTQYQPAITAAIKQLDTSITSQQKLYDSMLSAADDIDSGKVDAQGQRYDVQEQVDAAKADITALKSDYDDNLKPALESMADTVAGVVSTLNGRSSQLSSASNSLSDAATSVTGKLGDAQSAISSMATELRQSANKLNALSKSIDEALASGNVDQLKSIIGSDPSALAEAVSAPVGVERIALFAADNFGSAMAPLYTTLALWVGALLTLVLINPVPSERARKQLDNPKSWQLFFGRFGACAIVLLLQSTTVCLGNMLFVGVQVAHPLLYLLSFWVASLVFGFIMYTLVSLFANLGKAIGVLLLIVQVTGGGGSYPLQLLPQFFQDISPFLPATHVINAMRAAQMGIYQNDFWIEILCELAFVLPFVVMGILRPMLSKLTYWFVEKVEESKLVA